jgi:hypothetical protein
MGATGSIMMGVLIDELEGIKGVVTVIFCTIKRIRPLRPFFSEHYL